VRAGPRDRPIYTIGKVQELTGLSARQIRYYESRGLLEPSRSTGNRRLYTPAQVELLRRIRTYLAQGLNLAGVRALLQEAAAADTPAAPAAGKQGRAHGTAGQQREFDLWFEEYPARHLLGRGTSPSIYPLSHPEQLLKHLQGGGQV